MAREWLLNKRTTAATKEQEKKSNKKRILIKKNIIDHSFCAFDWTFELLLNLCALCVLRGYFIKSVTPAHRNR